MRLALPIYSDYVCPFCFLHAEIVRDLQAPEELDVQWRGVEIHPDTPAAGRPLAFAGSYAHKWEAHIAPLAAELNIPLEFPTVLPNTHQALLATALADSQGCGSTFHQRTMTAYWRDRRDIGEPTVLLDIGRDAGLKATDAGAWQTPEMEAAVARTREAAHDDMATGFPTTMLGEFPLVGLQTPRDLRTHLQRYRALLAKRHAAPAG